jgi:hypothetical protein
MVGASTIGLGIVVVVLETMAIGVVEFCGSAVFGLRVEVGAVGAAGAVDEGPGGDGGGEEEEEEEGEQGDKGQELHLWLSLGRSEVVWDAEPRSGCE